MEQIPNENLPKTTALQPAIVKVQPGKTYSWCTCGLSATQPFCDHAHRNIVGEPYKSIKVVFDKETEVLFCECRKTKTPPFCDDTCASFNK